MKPLIYILVSLSLLSSSIAQENKTLWTVAWSPDDKWLAVGGSEGELKLFDGQTFDLIKTYSTGGEILSRLKWHPIENKLAVITQSQTFKAKILDLDKQEWIELEGLESSLRALDWNHTGKLLAVSEFEGEISIFNKKGERISRFIADSKSVTGIDWHPNQDILASVGSQIGIFDSFGNPINTFFPRKMDVFLLCVEWHKSGKFFAVGDYGETESGEHKLIQFWNVKGEKLGETPSSHVEYRNVRWSPDGKYLASANDALRIWNSKGELIKETEASNDYLWGVNWNSNGTRIITTSDKGIVSLWDSDLNQLKKSNTK